MSKKPKQINLSEITPEEKMKYEIAEELGLLDKVLADGWKALSSKETGRIGTQYSGVRQSSTHWIGTSLSGA